MTASHLAEDRWPAVVGTEVTSTAFAVAAAGCGLQVNIWDRYGEIAEISAAGLEFWVWLPAAISAVTAGTLWWLIAARRQTARMWVGACVGAIIAGFAAVATILLANLLVGRGLMANPQQGPPFAPFTLMPGAGMLLVLVGLGSAVGAVLGRFQMKLFAGRYHLRAWRKVRVALAAIWVLSGPMIFTYGQLLPAIRGLWIGTSQATAERLKVGMSIQHATAIIGGPPGDYRFRPRPRTYIPRSEPREGPSRIEITWTTDRGRITVVTGYIILLTVDGLEKPNLPQGYVYEVLWEPAEPSDPIQLTWPVFVRVVVAVVPLAAWWVVSRRRFAGEVYPT